MDVLLIRHGESQADVLHVIEGRADFALTDTGAEQARRMAAWVNTHYNVSLPLERVM